MSTSTDAILAYGFDLGGEDAGWKVREAQDGLWEPEWFNQDTQYPDLIEDAERVLLASVGFVERNWRADGYWPALDAHRAELGVELVTYCHLEFPAYILSANTTTAHRGDVVECGWIGATPIPDWDRKLQRALKVLGATPIQEKPAWLLVSYWG